MFRSKNMIALGSSEGLTITEDPVVEKPEAVSNKASVKLISGKDIRCICC